MTDILLMYEHKARELDNVCLLAAELERRGYSVGVLNRFDYKNHNKYLLANKPKLICTVACYGDQSLFAQAQQFAGNVKKIVNFRWEQLFAGDASTENSFHFPKGNSKNVVHLCWGKKPKEQLERCGAKHAVLTGPIQMDFLAGKLDVLYKPKEELCREFGIHTKYVLLYISSFAYASYDDAMIEHDEQVTGYQLKQCAIEERLNRDKTLDILTRLLEERDDMTVVYRPHPSERNTKEIAEAARKNDRFKVINAYSVKQWIKASDYVVTWISTSIVEAYFAGKQVTILRPDHVPEIDNPMIYEDCRSCKDYSEFINELDQHRELGFPISEEKIGQYYDEDPDNLSYIRTADLLEEMLRSDAYDYTGKPESVARIYKTAAVSKLKALLFTNKIGKYLCCHVKPFTVMKFSMDEYENYQHNIVSQREIRNRIEEIKHAIEQK